MNITTQRFIDRVVGVPVLWVLSVIAQCLPRKAVTVPRAILIILLSEMGSLVCAQAMILDLRRRYPEAKLHILLLGKNKGVVDLLGLFADDCVITIDDRSALSFLRTLGSAIARLRRAAIDTVIDCELFARISAILSFLSGAALRVGFDRHNQEGLYRGSVTNRPVPYNPYLHISSQFLVLAGAIDSRTHPLGKLTEVPERAVVQRLTLSEQAVTEAAARLIRDYPKLAARRLVMLYPGSGILPIRAWPIDRFEAVARALIAEGYAVAVIGLPDDRALGERIVSAAQSEYCVNLAGYTGSLRELVHLFARAHLLISNDGGPGHFAALTTLPVVSLFGPETPTLYAPLCERGESLFRRMPCAPCLTAYNHRNTPCDGDNRCLQAIEVADVLAAARRLLLAA